MFTTLNEGMHCFVRAFLKNVRDRIKRTDFKPTLHRLSSIPIEEFVIDDY